MRELITETIEEVIDNTDKVIIHFFGNYCQPCKSMIPVLQRFDEETEYEVLRVNVEDFPEESVFYGVTCIPTFIACDRGEIKHMFSGEMLYDQFIQVIKEV